jgi:hypothetical protein
LQWTIECLQGVRDDLLFLQKHHRTVRRRRSERVRSC